MKNRHNFYALVFTLLLSFNANSQGPHATDVDLKAAYCYPTVKYEHEEYNKFTERYPNPSKLNEIKNLNEAGVVYNSKLQIYLRARNQSHNLEARNEVLAAISAGERVE